MQRATAWIASVALLAGLSLGCKKHPKGDTSLLEDLPENTETVGGVRLEKFVEALKTFGYYDQARQGLLAQSELLQKLDTSCNIDPLSQIKAFTFGYGPDLKDASQRYFVVELGVTRDKVHSCMGKLEGEGVEVGFTEKGDYIEYRADQDTYTAWWPDNKRVLFVQGTSPDPIAGVKAGKNASSKTELAAMVKKGRTDTLFWTSGMVPKDPELETLFGQLGATPKSGYIWMDIDASEVTAEVMLVFASESDAESIVTKAKAALDMLKSQNGALSGIELERTGVEVKASAELDEQAVKALSSLVN